MRPGAKFIVVALLVAACGEGPVGSAPDLVATCGAVRLAGGTNAELPTAPLDNDAQNALASIDRVAPGEAGFLDGYEWFIAERRGDSLVLFGRSLVPPPDGAPAYADASFQRTPEGWRPTGWGQCRIEVAAGGFGNARWVLDEEPRADALELALLINERECASGQAPVDRDVVPVVVIDADRVTITVLVEPVRGDTTCPTNPWHPVIIELPEPLGGRKLFDGSEVPVQERTWPRPEDPFGPQS